MMVEAGKAASGEELEKMRQSGFLRGIFAATFFLREAAIRNSE
jgi:hypothetical protein